MANAQPARIVIVGAGFAGLQAARSLADSHAEITLVDRHNYHVFQPLLYQIATASLSPAEIAVSIRSLFRRDSNVRVLFAEVNGIDRHNRKVSTTDAGTLDYDYLIVATGSQYNYFGHAHWQQLAPGLKNLDDAQRIRRQILLAFEEAEKTQDATLQKRLLTFVLIGAGPTGVELAGAISEVVKEGLADFRHIDPDVVEVVLIEAGADVLNGFPERIRRYTRKMLERRKVKLLLNCPVSEITPHGVQLADRFLASSSVIWCAGVKATPVAEWLQAERARNGAVLVEPDLSLPGHPEIFIAGDSAAVKTENGYLPGLASVAKQEGAYIGKLIARRLQGKAEPKPFHYTDLGTMATIGRGAAAADFGFVQLTGYFAWLLWGLVHIYYLIGFRNRLAVFIDWMWNMMRRRRHNWLITGPSEKSATDLDQQVPSSNTDSFER
jgi:NADH dehydrogenase, FAD-containing subunit